LLQTDSRQLLTWVLPDPVLVQVEVGSQLSAAYTFKEVFERPIAVVAKSNITPKVYTTSEDKNLLIIKI